MKIVYVILGFLLLGLGVVGIILPGLPATPFILLAAGTFFKSSPRLYRWMLSNKYLNKYITTYGKKKGLAKKQKIFIISLMWLMIGISSIFHYKNFIIFFIVISAGIIGTAYLLFFVPTQK